jgi:HEAT repeat protein
VSDAASQRDANEIVEAGRTRDTDRLTAGLRDPRYRGVAARLLGRAGATETIPQIELLLNAADPKARLGAVRALSMLESTGSYDRILELAHSDPHHNVRLWSIAAVGQIGGAGAAAFLVSLLGDSDWDTRRAAAYALGKLRDPSAVDPLMTAAKHERLYRRGVYRRAVRAIRSASTV